MKLFNKKTEEPEDSEEDYTADDYNLSLNDQAVYDSIQLQDKLIEPDKAISDDLSSRNWQLANIRYADHKYSMHEYSTASLFLSMPKEYGGWLTKEYGSRIIKRMDFYFTSSNSIGGELRKNINTIRRIFDKPKKKKRSMFRFSEEDDR